MNECSPIRSSQILFRLRKLYFSETSYLFLTSRSSYLLDFYLVAGLIAYLFTGLQNSYKMFTKFLLQEV